MPVRVRPFADALEQLSAAEHDPRLRREQREQLELDERERDGRAPDVHRAARKVDDTIRRLPGFSTVTLLEAWMDRFVEREPVV